MLIYIEFYASLMKYLPPGDSRFRREVKVDDDISLSKVIRQFHIADEEAHLVLVNGHFVNCGEDRDSRKLQPGDTVSVWPPVAGG